MSGQSRPAASMSDAVIPLKTFKWALGFSWVAVSDAEIHKCFTGTRLEQNPLTCSSSTYSYKFCFTRSRGGNR